jgi:hypothetical protein
MNDEPEFLSDKEMEEIKRKEIELEKKAATHLAKAKEKAARIGKEPFDLDILVSHVKNKPLEEDAKEFREAMIKDYEYRYYAKEDVMTLKEFAEFLDECAIYGF